ncbi:MAG TPA: restriction endonuclease, partial [Thermoleophilia bacterium]|nr:restriction endonuclease [Thermoleophilia bacterium]
TMTILDEAHVQRTWIADLKRGLRDSPNAPGAWLRWAESARYLPRQTKPTVEWRKPSEQRPQDADQKRILEAIRKHYSRDPYGFENFAAALVMRMEPDRVTDVVVTPPRRDGGRDALGLYRIGFGSDPVSVEFALEAKCTSGGLGVKQVARLLSRIRYRQFGVIVTTSYVSEQAYREIKEDRHPVVVIAGRDIAEALIKLGYSSDSDVHRLLEEVDGSPVKALGVTLLH